MTSKDSRKPGKPASKTVELKDGDLEAVQGGGTTPFFDEADSVFGRPGFIGGESDGLKPKSSPDQYRKIK